MILSAKFSKGFVQQESAAKKVSSAIGGCASRRAKKQTSAARGFDLSGGEEGNVWIRGVVGMRGARKGRTTYRLVKKSWMKEAGAVTAVETRPNQSLEPTPPAGTSAAEQPLVPAAVVAHL